MDRTCCNNLDRKPPHFTISPVDTNNSQVDTASNLFSVSNHHINRRSSGPRKHGTLAVLPFICGCRKTNKNRPPENFPPGTYGCKICSSTNFKIASQINPTTVFRTTDHGWTCYWSKCIVCMCVFICKQSDA